MANTQSRKLVIVESPTKATKIASFLGNGYDVESSRGHVRDLPTGAAEVPARYKGEKWARIGVNVDKDFTPLYVVAPEKKTTIRALKAKLADADELLLATDEDREGEAIAWHLLQELKPKVPVRRMVFHEITPQAIADAVANPRELDLDLVDAQETRRILDRLYGYEVSPVLWKKVMPGLSAGRVQSVATRLVVDRERERIAFVAADYFGIDADLSTGPDATPPTFAARLTAVGGRKVATGRDFSSEGKLTTDTLRLDQVTAEALVEALRPGTFTVNDVESRPYTRRPYAPFRTTTLQQDAGRKLGFSAQRTMSVAQALYEGGFITYMRTDSVTLSQTAIAAARAQAVKLYGPDSVPSRPRVYTSKVKNAQEAHEAIRPAGETFSLPNETGLHGDGLRLYELIWKRTVASQMIDAEGNNVKVTIDAALSDPVEVDSEPTSRCVFTASGRTITKPGFLQAYVEATDDDKSDDAQARLPHLTAGQTVDAISVDAAGHQTRPPARYTEPSLVAKLEELEIGRPSTYASIIRTITSRDYVFKRGSALVPTWLAFSVTRLLEEHFPELVDYSFTAEMEGVLDQIAAGDANRLAVLSEFYFGSQTDSAQGLQTLVSDLGDIDAREMSSFPLGEGVVLRVGRYGPYVTDGEERRANVPPDLAPDELTPEVALELLSKPTGGRELGPDPASGHMIVLKDGRYGPYVTEVLPEDSPKTAKPRTSSLFKSMDPATVSLEDALLILSLPRTVGAGADGEQITAHNGPYGPYLKKGRDSRSLASEEQLFSITLPEAEAIYAQPKTRGNRAASALKVLGSDPSTEREVSIKQGRFGAYVTDGEYNATLKKTDSIDAMTLEQAAEMLAEKRAAGPPKKPATRRKTTSSTTRSRTTKKSSS